MTHFASAGIVTYLVQLIVFLFLLIRKEEQIKKDEQYARVLQEQMDQNSSTTTPETRGSDLSPQTRVGGDQPGSEQVRRGQVRVEST